MDDSPASYKSVSENVGTLCESSKETPHCAFGNIGGLSVNDLGNRFTDYLNIQDTEDSNDKCNIETVKEDVSKDSHECESGNAASVKCLIKCATFPCSGMSVPPVKFGGKEQEDEMKAEHHGADAKSPNLPYSRSISLPTLLKLVSAIKGSREKQGSLPRKLTVTWAPDVYDLYQHQCHTCQTRDKAIRMERRRMGRISRKTMANPLEGAMVETRSKLGNMEGVLR